jgi:Flp pilus assembly protein TadD
VSRSLLLPLVLALASAASCAGFDGARLYQRGTHALERGDPASAVRDLERAGELLPHASEVQNHLGLAYLEAGREREARAAFERAVTLDCDNQAAQHNLAAVGGGPPPEPDDASEDVSGSSVAGPRRIP